MEPINSDLFICPQCKGALQPGPQGSERLDCQNCPLSYPLRDGVPALVINQANARPVPTDDEFERLISEALQASFSHELRNEIGQRSVICSEICSGMSPVVR
jgi:uncharacterized protein YbaR (Trm112 family)